MVARPKSVFVCTDCGNDTPRWQGQCPACEGWNTLIEEKVARPKGAAASRAAAGSWQNGRPKAEIVRLVDVGDTEVGRWTSGLDELDFVLGGGVVPGSVVLIGGEPGIGKSTLLLQSAARLLSKGHTVLYVTGEESVAQVRMRSDRLEEATDEVNVLAETDLDSILQRTASAAPNILFIDSIQTVLAPELDGVPGSVGQVRECAARFQRFAKETGTTVFLVGHVTKGGNLAGPKTLEHIVDTVLYFESAGGADYRLLRATKNRFGSVSEIGVFSMNSTGLVPVANPSELFLGDRSTHPTGSAVTSIMEGSRPLLVEIQALTAPAPYGAPQRVAGGFEHKRLSLLLAVLEKRARLAFGQSDVFLNVVGGLRISEPVADAAVVAALASASLDRPLPHDTVILGEIGLGGELRGVSQIDRRISEAARMGFQTAIVPRDNRSTTARVEGLKVRSVSDVAQLMDEAFA